MSEWPLGHEILRVGGSVRQGGWRGINKRFVVYYYYREGRILVYIICSVKHVSSALVVLI